MIAIFLVSTFTGCLDDEQSVRVSNPYMTVPVVAAADSIRANTAENFQDQLQKKKLILDEWSNCQLDLQYSYVFLQRVDVSQRFKQSADNFVNVAIGIDSSGFRKVLSVNWSNSQLGWAPTFATLENRGVKVVNLFVVGDNQNIGSLIAKHYPHAKWQLSFDEWRKRSLEATPETLAQKVDFHVETVQTSNCSQDAVMALNVFFNQLDRLGLVATKMVASKDVDHLLTHFDFPEGHRHKIHLNHSLSSTLETLEKGSPLIWESKESFVVELMSILKAAEEIRWARQPYLPSRPIQYASF